MRDQDNNNSNAPQRPDGKVSRAFVDTLTDLMERRSREELIQCLIDYLNGNPHVDDVAVLELFNRENENSFNSDNVETALYRKILSTSEPGEPITRDQDFLQCVTSQQPVLSGGPGSRRLILPARGLRDISGLVVVYGDDVADEEYRYRIEVMVNIWNSHLCLIDKNERDVLTGLLNRQAFESIFPRIMRELMQQKNSSHGDSMPNKVIAMFDIDHFKNVNDRFGHLYGDEVIVHFARLMNRSFRYYDLMFRYGGEEFVVVLSNVNLELAEQILERFRKAVEQYDFPQVGTKTVSIGFLEINMRDLPTTMVDKADKAMYYAKQNGRNRICAYEKLVQSGALSEAAEDGDVELF